MHNTYTLTNRAAQDTGIMRTMDAWQYGPERPAIRYAWDYSAERPYSGPNVMLGDPVTFDHASGRYVTAERAERPERAERAERGDYMHVGRIARTTSARIRIARVLARRDVRAERMSDVMLRVRAARCERMAAADAAAERAERLARLNIRRTFANDPRAELVALVALSMQDSYGDVRSLRVKPASLRAIEAAAATDDALSALLSEARTIDTRPLTAQAGRMRVAGDRNASHRAERAERAAERADVLSMRDACERVASGAEHVAAFDGGRIVRDGDTFVLTDGERIATLMATSGEALRSKVRTALRTWARDAHAAAERAERAARERAAAIAES